MTKRIRWHRPLPKIAADALMGPTPIGTLNGVRFCIHFRCRLGVWAASAYRAGYDYALIGPCFATYDVWGVRNFAVVKRAIVRKIHTALDEGDDS